MHIAAPHRIKEVFSLDVVFFSVIYFLIVWLSFVADGRRIIAMIIQRKNSQRILLIDDGRGC